MPGLGSGPGVDSGGAATEVTVLSQTVTLTNAQIKALPETPIVLVADQDGEFANPVSATLHLANWVADYNGINAAAVMKISVGLNEHLVSNLDNAVNTSVGQLLAGGGPDGTWAFLGPFQRVSSPVTYGIAGYYDSDLIGQDLQL